ncbi:primosomal replication protein N [Clostridium carboxidivorans P7]|uniref:Primosome, DnaD subunit n=1 Tax=Clostridium carboxidivorans P7 TaxID=536227 RepID=C6PNZ0_9CLOT|nr:DnaD domain protein [Clostridium carboxidivorans]AKN31256.1 primosomal replication protein N [Clostridium carboxidivorans P7]EET89068.1 primosome, DnaD subunit [Clostridium carboxidivorans P7]EFG88378.1 DnaD and phage-associated domain protein [Clostridium carboxidivorans P7]
MKKVLLENEITMVFQPKLAEIFGVTESIILQQIHYWLLKSTHIIDGTPWIYNSYEAWHNQISFLCKRTIIRAIKKLETSGVVLSSNFNKSKMDKTKWYTIDYEKLESLCDSFENSTNSIIDTKGKPGENSSDTSEDDKKLEVHYELEANEISIDQNIYYDKDSTYENLDDVNKSSSKYLSTSSIESKSPMDNAYFNKAIPEITTETYLKKEEEGFADVVNFYSDNISCASPYEIDLLKNFMEDFNSKDLIILGMKQALKSNAKNLRYIEKVLYSWKNKGLRDEKEVINYLNNYKKHKNYYGFHKFKTNSDFPDDYKKLQGKESFVRTWGNYEKNWGYNSETQEKEFGKHESEEEKTEWYQGDMEGLI